MVRNEFFIANSILYASIVERDPFRVGFFVWKKR